MGRERCQWLDAVDGELIVYVAVSTRTGSAAGRTSTPAHQHTIYCSAADRALIGRRAEEAGMSFSRFMIACALHGGDGDDGEEGRR